MHLVTATQPNRVDGVHYTVTGEGRRTIVLLHGFCDNLSTWKRVVPVLAASNRVIAVDLPGFGRSTRPWRAPLIESYVDVVAEVLAAEEIDEPVSLIGNSMGAVVSAAFAQRWPEAVDRVVLIDMPGLRGVPRLWRVGLSRPAELGLRAALRVVGDKPAQFGLGWAYGRIASGAPWRLDPAVGKGFGDPFLVKGSVPALLPIGRALLSDLAMLGLDDLVGSLNSPALLIFGSRDVLTPARVLRRVGRAGAAVVLPRCGHCPQIDQPEALLGEVMPFLAQQPMGTVTPAA